MKSFKKLIKKDTIMILNNYFLYVTIFIAVLFILLVNFVIPENIGVEPKIIMLSEYKEGDVILNKLAEENPNIQTVKTRKELEEKMEENFNSMGYVLIDPQNVEYVLQGYENDITKNLLELEIESSYQEFGSTPNFSMTKLRNVNTEKLPFNKSIVPLFLVMEPALLGLFLIATMVFTEKEERTIKAYAVTPGSMLSFLVSKEIVLIALGFVSLLSVTLLTIGFEANYGWLILLTICGSLMGSGMGLLIASFFDNLSQAMVWVIVGAIILSLPFASYFAPSFSPLLVRVLPVYPLMFAYKEAIFSTGNTSLMLNACILSLVIGVVLLFLANINLKRTLSK